MARPRTPDTRRVRTVMLGGGVRGKVDTLAAAGEARTQVMDYWVPMDDIRIIGAEVGAEIDMQLVHLDDDGEAKLISELSLGAPVEAAQGVIAYAEVQSCCGHVVGQQLANWTDCRRQVQVMFPDGYGIDVDEGSPVNLNVYCYWKGGDAANYFVKALIYYVER